MSALSGLSDDQIASLDRAIEHGKTRLADQVQGLRSFLERAGVSSEMMFDQISMRHAQIVATTEAIGALEEIRAVNRGAR